MPRATACRPRQRGYGATTGWDDRYDGDVASFRTHSYARDALGVLEALGHRSVDAVVGHDFESMIGASCALVRPDVFLSLVIMSFPFNGPPSIPFETADKDPKAPEPSMAARLAALPRPRQDSMAWFGTPTRPEHAERSMPAFEGSSRRVELLPWARRRSLNRLRSCAASDFSAFGQAHRPPRARGSGRRERRGSRRVLTAIGCGRLRLKKDHLADVLRPIATPPALVDAFRSVVRQELGLTQVS